MRLYYLCRDILYLISDYVVIPVWRKAQKIRAFTTIWSSLGYLFRYTFWKSRLAYLGKGTNLPRFLVIHNPENVYIGNDVGIAEFVHIWGTGGVTIHDNVQIAAHTSIVTLTHLVDTDRLYRNTLFSKPVVIHNDVWIGSGAVILPGVSIGKHSVIGAGSVVTKDVPELVVVVGAPARIIRRLKK